MNERDFDFGDRLDKSVDRGFRKMVRAVVGDSLSSEVSQTVSGSSEAASVRGGSTANVLLGHA